MMPKANQIYKHFKGNLYRVVTMAKHSETEEDMVVYQALYGEYQVYIRPLDSFLEELDKKRYPYATQNYRFEPVREMVEPVERNKNETEAGMLLNSANSVEIIQEKQDCRQEVTIDMEISEKKISEIQGNNEEIFKNDEEVVAQGGKIDPMLEAYLDTDSYREKLNILHGLRHRITEHMLLTMAVVIDFELPEGSIETKYDALNDCLLTKERYECNRMI